MHNNEFSWRQITITSSCCAEHIDINVTKIIESQADRASTLTDSVNNSIGRYV